MVDLVDDDDAVEAALDSGLRDAAGRDIDAGLGIDDDHGGLHRCQHCLRTTQQIEVAGRVDQVDAPTLHIEMTDGGIDRVP